MRKSLACAAAALTACALTSTPSHAVTLKTAGTGWKLTTQLGVTSLSPSRQYTITFATSAIKARYSPLLTAEVAQVNSVGVRLKIGGVETVNPAKCGPIGHIQITELYRPMGRGGYSQGMPCPNPPGGVGAGGIVAYDSEYWDGTWRMETYKLHNIVAHEPLHALGLDHPNRRDANGIEIPYGCVTTSYGNTPVMCSPNGGYKTATGMGHLTGYDLNGLRALLANARAQGIK